MDSRVTGIDALRRTIELILKRLNLYQSKMNELSREELLEIMSSNDLDLSWIASQESVDVLKSEVDEIKTGVQEIKTLVLDLAEKVGIEPAPELPDNCGSESDLENWTYNIDGESIDLISYSGDIETLHIYPQYYINNNIYNTVFTTVNNSSTSRSLASGNYKNIIFHSGLAEVPLRSLIGTQFNALETVSMTGPCTYYAHPSGAGGLASSFQNCTSLVSVDLSLFTPISTYDMSMTSAFAGCTALTTVKMPKAYCEGKAMGFAFENCSSLTELDLTSVTASYQTTMYSMFKNCTNLQKVTVKTGKWPSKTAITNNSGNFTNMFLNAGVQEFTYVS